MAARALHVSLALATLLAAACSYSVDANFGRDDDGADPLLPDCHRDQSCVADGQGCERADQCASGVCRAQVCVPPSPTDGVKNGDETDVDCGGASAPACPPGKGCQRSADCTEWMCSDGRCTPGHATDGVKNGTETDVDCGGPNAPGCAVGLVCALGSDCLEKVCDATSQTCAPPRYDDGVQNGDETGIDCGGPNAPARCAVGIGCRVGDDCVEKVCDATSQTCAAPSATDGVKNGTETGVDCGGPAALRACPVGDGCAAHNDCVEKVCDASTNTCAAPSFADGVKNGTETDVDCGGPAAAPSQRCALAQACAAATDCASGGCGQGVCTYPSCGRADAAGLRTCGSGEVGQAGAQHESCCRSLPLPTLAHRRLDKYEITAGRMRSFVTALNATDPNGQGNLRAWADTYVANHPASQLARMFQDAPTLRQLLPASYNQGNLSTIAHLGVLDMDNYGGIRGCYMGNGSYGSATYWLPQADLARYGIQTGDANGRLISQEQLDAKSLSCTTPLMLAAFCAWDGGELASTAEIHDAWGPSTYPWGANDIGRPQYNWCNGRYGTGGFNCQNPALGNGGIFYGFPLGGLNGGESDLSFLIAAPGRLPGDLTARQSGGESWRDLFANLAEYSGDFVGTAQDFCDFSGAPVAGLPTCSRAGRNGTGTRYTGIPGARVHGHSWEGHPYGRAGEVFTAMFQYGKFGGRCSRPL